MKRSRDARGRYVKEYRKATWVEKLYVVIMISFFIGTIIIEEVNQLMKPVYAENIQIEEEIKEEPREVRIKIVYSTLEQKEARIREVFTDTPNTAVAVAKAESGEYINEKAYNPEWHYDEKGNAICQGSYGAFQIACVHEPDVEKLYDFEYNLQKAKEIKEKSNWFPWGGYTSGGWKKFL